MLMLETFSDLRQIQLAIKVAKQKTDLPVIAQMAFHEQGHTQHGVSVLAAMEAMLTAGADVVGTNCGRGFAAWCTPSSRWPAGRTHF